jgi:hypothetical protein
MMVAMILIFMVQGCMTTSYNNRNWRRLPPSTGHSRCGCLMQKPNELISKSYGETNRA